MNTITLRRNIRLAFILVALIGGLNACTVITTGSQTDAISRSGGWAFDSFTIGTPTSGQSTAYKGMTVVFTSSGSVTFTTAAEARAAGFPATYTGTWSLTSLEVLSLTVPGLWPNSTFNITELNATTFRFKGTLSGGGELELKWTAK